MLILRGQLMNIYETPVGVNQKTGEEYGGKDRLQLLCYSVLRNGEQVGEIINLTVDDAKPYKDKLHQELTLPVGVMAVRSEVIYYVTKAPQKQSA